MTLQIPTTAADPVEWIRRAAGAVNAVIKDLAALVKRTIDLETFQGTATTTLGTLDTRTTALETFTATPFTVASITLPPATLPAAPVHGELATDVADGKLKFYDGTVWQPLY